MDKEAQSNLSERPVYEVIADFPNNKDFPVGSIIYLWPWARFYWKYSVMDCQGERQYTNEFFDKYPHIFKKLADHDGRTDQ